MKFRVVMSDFGKVTALLRKVRPAGRAQLHSVGAHAAMVQVQRHIHRYAPGKHYTATSLGAKATGHYEKGAAAITSTATADRAEVSIPIPGIGRAYHDIEITPVRANRLTIPISAISYGHTVKGLAAQGWKFFQGMKGHEAEDILFGYKGKGNNRIVKPLFVLKTYIHQRQDPKLLPTQQDLGNTFAGAIRDEIIRVMRKAGR